jgi:hypothetical protein
MLLGWGFHLTSESRRGIRVVVMISCFSGLVMMAYP